MIRAEYIKQNEVILRFLFDLHKSKTVPKRRAAMHVLQKQFKLSKIDAESKVQVWCANFNEIAEVLNITLTDN